MLFLRLFLFSRAWRAWRARAADSDGLSAPIDPLLQCASHLLARPAPFPPRRSPRRTSTPCPKTNPPSSPTRRPAPRPRSPPCPPPRPIFPPKPTPGNRSRRRPRTAPLLQRYPEPDQSHGETGAHHQGRRPGTHRAGGTGSRRGAAMRPPRRTTPAAAEPTPATPASDEDEVRVNYVPDVVKNEIRDDSQGRRAESRRTTSIGARTIPFPTGSIASTSSAISACGRRAIISRRATTTPAPS